MTHGCPSFQAQICQARNHELQSVAAHCGDPFMRLHHVKTCWGKGYELCYYIKGGESKAIDWTTQQRPTKKGKQDTLPLLLLSLTLSVFGLSLSSFILPSCRAP